MVEAVKKYSGVDFMPTSARDEEAVALRQGAPCGAARGAHQGRRILAEFFDAFVEDKLIQPTFIYDYPVEISPLAKRKPDDPAFTERFEYFINATEFGNAFSELNDPIDQKRPLRAPGRRAQGHRPGLQGSGGLRLCQCAGVRHAPHGRPWLRRRPSGHAAD